MTEFGTLCGELGGVLQRLEWDRQRRLGLLWKTAGVLATLAAVTALVLKEKNGDWFGGVLVAAGALILWAIVAAVHSSRFVGAFKAEVMPALVQAMGPNLAYTARDWLDEWEFEECGLFQSPDRYRGSDLVEGVVEKTHVRFSLVHAEEEYEVADTETDTDSDGNTTTRTVYRTEYRDIFRGLLFSADCNKHFSGRTYVCAGGSGFLARLRRDHVRLESPDFSRAFTVYSSDQVEARYLLSPSLMQRILELHRRAGSIQLSFVDSRLYLAMPMSLGAFTPSFWRRIDDASQLAGYYNLLSFIVGMVEDLNLNTRIWSKR
jgi:hypothetical protein